MADTKMFQLQVISPDRIFFDGEVDMVEVKTTEGEMGIYRDHIPLTAIVAPGILKIHQNGEIKEAALLEGFIEVLKERVTILAEACEWPEEIDVNRANEAKLRAERRLKSSDLDINKVRAELALRKSLTRLSLVEEQKR